MANPKINMFKCFFKVLKGDEQETNLVIPDMYVQDIYKIDYDFLKAQGYTNLLFDIDNTIMEVNSLEVGEELISLFQELNKQKFNICLMSNNGKERVIPVASKLETGYLFKSGKPLKKAYDKALTLLDADKETTVMVGDQMLTDIKGANEYGLYTVLVEPYDNKYDIKTGTSRVLQNIMMKKLTKTHKFKRYNYYKRERNE